MKRKDSRLRIRIFYGILLIPTLLWALLSLAGVAKHLDFDTGEKRNKHEMAEDTKLSNVTQEMETWYDDRVPFRSVLLSINSTLDWIVEFPYTKVIEPALIHLANASMEKENAQQAALPENVPPQKAENSTDTAASADNVYETVPEDYSGPAISTEGYDPAAEGAGTEDPAAMDSDAMDPAQVSDSKASAVLSTLPPYYESPLEAGYYPYKELSAQVIQGRDGWLFTQESYPDFIGANMPSEEALAAKLSSMDQLNQLCQNKGIQLHIVAMPNKNTVYPEYMPSVDHVEYSAVNVLEDYVHDRSGVSFHFLDDEMLGAKVYGQLYYKHDTHWNNRGGLAASAYIRNIFGLPPVDIGSISYGELTPYAGDLATYSGLPAASFDQENAIEMYYKQEIPQQLVRGGDDLIDEVIAQNTESDKTLVLVGDSYRHSLVPYFSRDFAHVYSINETRMTDEVAGILNSADIILLEGVERNFFFLSHFDETIQELIYYMS